jgi:hopanoid biosynthesis associated RND transporter like protein HpnN
MNVLRPAANLDRVIGGFLAQWVRFSTTRPVSIISAFAVAMVLLSVYTVDRLGINTDTADMISDRLGWRQDFEDFRHAFPGRYNVILVVIDGNQPRAARRAADQLQKKLLDSTATISSVLRPGAGEFFDTNGLLYLETEQLEELADRLTSSQPLLGRLAEDFSLAQLIESLDEALRRGTDEDLINLIPVLRQLAEAIAAVTTGNPYEFEWSQLIGGGPLNDEASRHFLIVKPILEFSSMQPAASAVRDIRQAAANLAIAEGDAVSVRLTGTVAMEHEELLSVFQGAWIAGLLAFTTVTIVLLAALGSLLTVAAAILALLFGLTATAAFAAAAVGSLNLISVAFGILYIGLGIDFIIHLTLRSQELIRNGRTVSEALPDAARDVGSSLTICAITTSAGFYAFIPTPFDGVSQLGLIAGTGMFISLFTTLTLLPALLALIFRARPVARLRNDRVNLGLLRPLTRHRRTVLIVASLVALVSMSIANRIQFDGDPINLRDPDAESVRTFRELVNATDAGPGTLMALSPDRQRTVELIGQLESLPLVSSADSIMDFVPNSQPDKLLIIDDLAIALGPDLREQKALEPPAAARSDQALRDLRKSILDSKSTADVDAVLKDLVAGIDAWFARTDPASTTGYDSRLAQLQQAVLGGLPEQLVRLDHLLGATPIDLPGLPPEISERWISPDGRQLIEIHPVDTISPGDGASQFARQVRDVVPDVTGLAIVHLEAEKTVVASFRLAFTYALIIVIIVLGIFLRSALDLTLVLGPILLAAAATIGFMVLLDMPLNFANIIALPLLLGIGVDNGIHMVHRMKMAPPADGDILRTSTSRAVLFSSLTTMFSFGSLAFSPHIGMAGMGTLLSIGLFASLLATLVLLPVLLEWTDQR